MQHSHILKRLFLAYFLVTLGFVVSHMKIFSFQLENLFYQYDLDTQQTRTIQTIFREGHIRNIPVKFGQNPASSLGRDAL